jgi:hypothetical protein
MRPWLLRAALAASLLPTALPPRLEKPGAPLDLVARVEARELVVFVAPRTAATVTVTAGPHRWSGPLSRGECRELRFPLADPAAEIHITAAADGGAARAIALNHRPAAPARVPAVNSRGERLLEYRPR